MLESRNSGDRPLSLLKCSYGGVCVAADDYEDSDVIRPLLTHHKDDYAASGRT